MSSGSLTGVACQETEYEEKQLYVLNFNDFPSAFGVWVPPRPRHCSTGHGLQL